MTIALSPLAVALQGIGFGQHLTALQGLAAVTVAPSDDPPGMGNAIALSSARTRRRVFATGLWLPPTITAVLESAEEDVAPPEHARAELPIVPVPWVQDAPGPEAIDVIHEAVRAEDAAQEAAIRLAGRAQRHAEDPALLAQLADSVETALCHMRAGHSRQIRVSLPTGHEFVWQLPSFEITGGEQQEPPAAEDVSGGITRAVFEIIERARLAASAEQAANKLMPVYLRTLHQHLSQAGTTENPCQADDPRLPEALRQGLVRALSAPNDSKGRSVEVDLPNGWCVRLPAPRVTRIGDAEAAGIRAAAEHLARRFVRDMREHLSEDAHR